MGLKADIHFFLTNNLRSFIGGVTIFRKSWLQYFVIHYKFILFQNITCKKMFGNRIPLTVLIADFTTF